MGAELKKHNICLTLENKVCNLQVFFEIKYICYKYSYILFFSSWSLGKSSLIHNTCLEEKEKVEEALKPLMYIV